MKKLSKADHQQKIDQARREVAHQVRRLQTALDRESTWIPKGQKWLLPMAAVGVGLALKGKSPKKKAESSEA